MKCRQNLMERQNATGARTRYYITATISMKSDPLKSHAYATVFHRSAADALMEIGGYKRVSLMAAMSAVMIALVVFIHLLLTDQPWGVWWRRWGVDGVCRLAVPWFYLASGAVFARHIGESEGWYGLEVWKRVEVCWCRALSSISSGCR